MNTIVTTSPTVVDRDDLERRADIAADAVDTTSVNTAGQIAVPATIVVDRVSADVPPQSRRQLASLTWSDVVRTGGALFSAWCLTMLLFGRLTPMTGTFGFVVVWMVLFVATDALLVSLVDNTPAVVDRVMTTLMTLAATIAGAALASVVGATVWKGRRALVRVNTYTSDMRVAGPLEPLSVGGIKHALVGTLIIIGLALFVTIPLGITCAVFLNESRGRFAGLVRTIVTAMTALPSILAGLFVFAMWNLALGQERSGLSASIAITIMMLPIVIRSADVVLRLVPGNLREASAALGAPRWRTIWHVVLPTARSGLSTSVILGMARGMGETAPVLLTSGAAATTNWNPLHNAMMSLPLATYQFVRSPQQTMQARGFASAAVLMVVVLIVFAIARVIGGRPAGHLSKLQSRKAAVRSRDDLQRIETALTARTAPAVVNPNQAASPS
jgi:phosphate transport system permease protein